MADTVRKVDYFSIQVPNTPAKAFAVLSTLVSSGINLLACIGVPRGRRAQIDVVPTDTRGFKAAVKKAGLSFTPENLAHTPLALNATLYTMATISTQTTSDHKPDMAAIRTIENSPTQGFRRPPLSATAPSSGLHNPTSTPAAAAA